MSRLAQKTGLALYAQLSPGHFGGSPVLHARASICSKTQRIAIAAWVRAAAKHTGLRVNQNTVAATHCR